MKMSQKEMEKWLEDTHYEFYCNRCHKLVGESYEVFNQVPDSINCEYCGQLLDLKNVVFVKNKANQN